MQKQLNSRERRERLAVQSRKAIQMARIFLDHETVRSPEKAIEWATSAAVLAEDFRKAVEAEAGGES
jgi:hypothetical protein